MLEYTNNIKFPYSTFYKIRPRSKAYHIIVPLYAVITHKTRGSGVQLEIAAYSVFVFTILLVYANIVIKIPLELIPSSQYTRTASTIYIYSHGSVLAYGAVQYVAINMELERRAWLLLLLTTTDIPLAHPHVYSIQTIVKLDKEIQNTRGTPKPVHSLPLTVPETNMATN